MTLEHLSEPRVRFRFDNLSNKLYNLCVCYVLEENHVIGKSDLFGCCEHYFVPSNRALDIFGKFHILYSSKL